MGYSPKYRKELDPTEATQHTCMRVYHIFFIHISVDGHGGYFHVLATVNSATMDIGVHVSFQIIFLNLTFLLKQFSCSKRDTDVQNSLLDSVGEGEGGKIWENGNETCKISCRKRVASPGSMHGAGCLGLVHWDDLEGWYGAGRGGGFRMGSTCVPVAGSF